jgi:hypothetical protein
MFSDVQAIVKWKPVRKPCPCFKTTLRTTILQLQWPKSLWQHWIDGSKSSNLPWSHDSLQPPIIPILDCIN